MIRRLDIFDGGDTPLAHVSGDFFLTGWKDLSRLYNKAVAAHLFSTTSTTSFEHTQDLLFLYVYLYLLNWDRKDILEATGTLPPREYLYELYALDTVRTYFACNFIEIIPLLAQFDAAIPAGVYDGLGYMHIHPGNTPEFIIS